MPASAETARLHAHALPFDMLQRWRTLSRHFHAHDSTLAASAINTPHAAMIYLQWGAATPGFHCPPPLLAAVFHTLAIYAMLLRAIPISRSSSAADTMFSFTPVLLFCRATPPADTHIVACVTLLMLPGSPPFSSPPSPLPCPLALLLIRLLPFHMAHFAKTNMLPRALSTLLRPRKMRAMLRSVPMPRYGAISAAARGTLARRAFTLMMMPARIDAERMPTVCLRHVIRPKAAPACAASAQRRKRKHMARYGAAKNRNSSARMRRKDARPAPRKIRLSDTPGQRHAAHLLLEHSIDTAQIRSVCDIVATDTFHAEHIRQRLHQSQSRHAPVMLPYSTA